VETLKCGGLKKHIVIKIEDLTRINSMFKIAMLKNDLDDIAESRKAEGKEPTNEYIVVNTDEPYIEEIIEVLKKHNAWG
jgi:hypothetical protein